VSEKRCQLCNRDTIIIESTQVEAEDDLHLENEALGAFSLRFGLMLKRLGRKRREQFFGSWWVLYQISLMVYYYAPTDILLTSLFTIAFLI
jgi:hypothetical protein